MLIPLYKVPKEPFPNSSLNPPMASLRSLYVNEHRFISRSFVRKILEKFDSFPCHKQNKTREIAITEKKLKNTEVPKRIARINIA